MVTLFIAILAAGLLVSFAVSLMTTELLRRFAPRLGLVDAPDHRKIHTQPIPRLGGIGILTGFAAGIIFFGSAAHLVPELREFISPPSRFFLVGVLMIGLLGLVDDVKGIDFREKLVFQCLVAVFSILAGFRYEVNLGAVSELTVYGDLVSIPLTFLWIIGVMNAVNLIDGLDGLAGGLALIAIFAVTMAEVVAGIPIQFALVLAMVGAILGFLRLNYHPASIFMGDTGSLLLGFFISVYSLETTSASGSIALFFLPVLAVSMPVFDTLSSMVRRRMRGRPVFYPDREHIHHRLRYLKGYSHRQTVLLLYAISVVFAVFGVLLVAAEPYGYGVSGLVLAAAFAFLLGLMYKLDYLDWRSYLQARRRRRAPEFAVRLGSITRDSIRWEPEKARR